jgi:histone H3/H4
MVIVKSRIKDYAELEGRHYNVSGDFPDALQEKIKAVIREACKRARDNGRNTIMPRDL